MRSISIVGAAACALVAGCAQLEAPAAADDPRAGFWALDGCPDGEDACLDVVIAALEAHYEALASTCDHDALFALAYLRTTEALQVAIRTPGYFAEPARINHQDVVFAGYYFAAYEAWHGGDREAVPEAWRIAFEIADEGGVNAAGNIALGTNAHVQRDLPYVLEEIGSVAAGAKADHDQANVALEGVYGPLIAEAAERFDPIIAELPPLPYAVLAGWREQAWIHAVALHEAPDLESRAEVAAAIETYAVDQIPLLIEVTKAEGDDTERDAHCWTRGPGAAP
ncbi:MAG: hypothetical protein EP329_28610 [Deltaproteobacteria bacterium]|nr:MAG: hypothetical protein EP329_28610 [Deltaproteobacteria bacterium]